MRLPFIVALVVLSAAAEEWSWDKKENSTSESSQPEASTAASDAAASPLDFNFSAESDETGQGTEGKIAEGRSLGSADIVEDILESGREGRALEGFSDVYNDPNVQEAIQAGNDTSARSYIQERLCNLGLSSVSLKLTIVSFYTLRRDIYSILLPVKYLNC